MVFAFVVPVAVVAYIWSILDAAAFSYTFIIVILAAKDFLCQNYILYCDMQQQIMNSGMAQTAVDVGV